jgi:type I restriction enzyme S subunit
MNNQHEVPFEDAFISVPVGKRKIQESKYDSCGSISVVDQGQSLVSGRTNRNDLLINDGPYIVFGDHTRIVKYVDFPFVAGADGVRLYKPALNFEPEYLYLFLRSVRLPIDGYGRHSKYLNELTVPNIPLEKQRQIAAHLKAQLAEVEKARLAAELQLQETTKLANAIIFESIKGAATKQALGNVLEEIKKGIGANWAEYPVLGATRNGLALAKEPPGKYPQKYKPVVPSTVFYNPMRILIGSIAFVDEDDTPGITSPDYVALLGKVGLVDSRWFYYWLRSPLGEQCILSLARGAVRERMLFNRLAEGEIQLTSFADQQKASAALKTLKPMRKAIEQQLRDIDLLPQKILAKAFEI